MEKAAVLLRGPPCSGKTTIAKALLRALNSTQREPISLDDGWAPGESRFIGGPGRYADLRGRPERVLVLELGWGEPTGEAFAGATRNPVQWFEVLRSEGRRVHVVRLRADPSTLARRAGERLDPRWRQAALYRQAQYENDPEVLALAERVAVEEDVIDTTNVDVDTVVSTILSKLGRQSGS